MIKPPGPPRGVSAVGRVLRRQDESGVLAGEVEPNPRRPQSHDSQVGSQVLIKCAGESPACIPWEQNVLC